MPKVVVAKEPVAIAYRGPDRRRYSGPERRSVVHDKTLPLWARMMAMVGIPGTIAFFLVWVVAQAIPALQNDLHAFRVENQRLGQLIAQNRERTEENHRLIVRICVAVTKATDDQCFK